MATRKLDPPTVVDTALKLLNEVGLDGLSLRRLAQELGVQGPALYRHFASKQDLLRAMADAMFTPEMAILERPPPRADWADWLIARSRAVRRIMLSYRDGGRLKEHLHNPSDQWPGLELLLQMMEEAGFAVESALYGIYTIGNHILGSVIAEQEMQARQELPADRAQIDPTRFPRIAYGAALRSQGRDFDREFEYGLHLIISGLRAGLDPSSTED
ncbi:TetR/AcrR family transcriptional regulator C-terminal domain-containing protein [Micromonospora sp. NPDC003197]